MSIGLKNVKGRKIQEQDPVPAVTSEISGQQVYPWKQADVASSSQDNAVMNSVVVQEAGDLPRNERARQAVLRARQIVAENKKVISQIHERRLGKDLRPAEITRAWSDSDDMMFFLKNNQSYNQGLLDKFRKWFWGDKSRSLTEDSRTERT